MIRKLKGQSICIWSIDTKAINYACMTARATSLLKMSVTRPRLDRDLRELANRGC